MKWKKIKGYPNYRLSENGDLYNVKTDSFLKGSTNPSGVKYVSLSKNGVTTQVQLAQLVLTVYKPSQTVINVYAIHIDLELENYAKTNVERCTLGDRKRMFNEIKKKQRGVYAYNNPKSKKKWRAAFKNTTGKYVTVGYYKTEFFARFNYIKAYKKEFGRLPY
jgi:hypothetical protein